MEKNLIEEYFKLFNHNQESVYWGSYDTHFEPFETPEGKLKYKNKVGNTYQTRHLKFPFKIENIANHLSFNQNDPNCDEDGLCDREHHAKYKKPIIDYHRPRVAARTALSN